MSPGRRAAVALVALTISAPAVAQDSAIVRHLLPVDVSRLRPFQRTYDILVHTRDSTAVLGARDVSLAEAIYAGAPAWLLVETRTGFVPSVESLYVAPDLRPLHWSAALGQARLGMEFSADSIYGATTAATGKQNIVVAGRPDLMVSTAMVETLIPLLPLIAGWSDSVGVLAVDLVSTGIVPGELAVVGEEDFMVDTATYRPSWVVVLRGWPRHVIYWIDKETGAALSIVQPVPAHIGTVLEFRVVFGLEQPTR